MTKRVFNFSAGPAAFPEKVLKKIQEELLNWKDMGFSVIETSHRSDVFLEMAHETVENIKKVLNVPKNYKVLLCSGGASFNFAAAPLNLSGLGSSADYFCTGRWSSLAIKEANKFCNVNIVANSESNNFTFIPEKTSWSLSKKATYVYYTPNETVHGLRFTEPPTTNDVPLVADMTSILFQETVDISKHGLIFAGAQKNIAPAGVTVVIIRDDLLGHARKYCPSLLNYSHINKHSSMPNTPPTFCWYVMGLTLKWLIDEGGVQEMHKRSILKSTKVYNTIDKSDFYKNDVNKRDRSIINIPFRLANEKITSLFIEEAQKNNIVQIKGHKSSGGIRVNLYNAITEKATNALVKFMKDFEQKHA